MASRSEVDKMNSLEACLAKLEARLFSIDHNLSFGTDFKEKKANQLDADKIRNLDAALAEQRVYRAKVESIATEIKRIIESKSSIKMSSSKERELKKLMTTATEILNSEANNRLMKHIKSLEEPSTEIDIDSKIEDLNRELHEATKVEGSEITIVVLGKRGVGKSTFVNYIRGKNSFLQGEDSSIAETGSVQTTFIARAFYFDATKTKNGESKKQDIKIWDYPGVGTREFPKEEYLQVIDSMPVDAYLYLFKNQLSEDDIEILNAIVESNKTVFLIQTNADGFILDDESELDLEEVRELVKKKWPQVREKAFDEYKKNQQIASCDKIKYYLISCKYLFLNDLFDFDKLFLDLAYSMPKSKMDNFISTLQAKSIMIFKIKYGVIKNFIPDWALRGAILDSLDNGSGTVEGFKVHQLHLIHRLFGVELISSQIDDLLCQIMKIDTNYSVQDFVIECLKLKLANASFDKKKLAAIKRGKKDDIEELEEFFEKGLDRCLMFIPTLIFWVNNISSFSVKSLFTINPNSFSVTIFPINPKL